MLETDSFQAYNALSHAYLKCVLRLNPSDNSKSIIQLEYHFEISEKYELFFSQSDLTYDMKFVVGSLKGFFEYMMLIHDQSKFILMQLNKDSVKVVYLLNIFSEQKFVIQQFKSTPTTDQISWKSQLSKKLKQFQLKFTHNLSSLINGKIRRKILSQKQRDILRIDILQEKVSRQLASMKQIIQQIKQTLQYHPLHQISKKVKARHQQDKRDNKQQTENYTNDIRTTRGHQLVKKTKPIQKISINPHPGSKMVWNREKKRNSGKNIPTIHQSYNKQDISINSKSQSKINTQSPVKDIQQISRRYNEAPQSHRKQKQKLTHRLKKMRYNLRTLVQTQARFNSIPNSLCNQLESQRLESGPKFIDGQDGQYLESDGLRSCPFAIQVSSYSGRRKGFQDKYAGLQHIGKSLRSNNHNSRNQVKYQFKESLQEQKQSSKKQQKINLQVRQRQDQKYRLKLERLGKQIYQPNQNVIQEQNRIIKKGNQFIIKMKKSPQIHDNQLKIVQQIPFQQFYKDQKNIAKSTNHPLKTIQNQNYIRSLLSKKLNESRIIDLQDQKQVKKHKKSTENSVQLQKGIKRTCQNEDILQIYQQEFSNNRQNITQRAIKYNVKTNKQKLIKNRDQSYKLKQLQPRGIVEQIWNNQGNKNILNEISQHVNNEQAQLIPNEQAQLILNEQAQLILNEQAQLIPNEQAQQLENQQSYQQQFQVDKVKEMIQDFKKNKIKQKKIQLNKQYISRIKLSGQIPFDEENKTQRKVISLISKKQQEKVTNQVDKLTGRQDLYVKKLNQLIDPQNPPQVANIPKARVPLYAFLEHYTHFVPDFHSNIKLIRPQNIKSIPYFQFQNKNRLITKSTKISQRVQKKYISLVSAQCFPSKGRYFWTIRILKSKNYHICMGIVNMPSQIKVNQIPKKCDALYILDGGLHDQIKGSININSWRVKDGKPVDVLDMDLTVEKGQLYVIMLVDMDQEIIKFYYNDKFVNKTKFSTYCRKKQKRVHAYLALRSQNDCVEIV